MRQLIKANRLKYLGVAAVLWGTLLCTQNTFAVENTRALATDSRIKVVAFQRNNVVPVIASTFTTTQIVFSRGETIENIQNGDVDAWTVSVQKGLPNTLFLKPTIFGSDTNMTVITTAHTYYFHLTSNPYRANQPNNTTYAIQFRYPEQARATLLANLRYNTRGKHPMLNAHKDSKNYHGDYSFSGPRSMMPLHIFDDGRFTYMQLQSGEPVPAIFAVDNAKGQESVVNYRREGQYLVIQQMAPQFTLREGKYHVVSIFNNRRIRQLTAHKEG